MMRDQRYVIEARRPDGSLDLTGRQPEAVFGPGAIHGMTADEIGKVVFRHHPEAKLYGDRVGAWPTLIDPRFRARVKTW